MADALDARLEGFENLQKQLSAFVDATLLLDSSDLNTSQRLALYMSRDFQAATAMAGLNFKMRAERKLYVDGRNYDPVLAADRISKPPKSVRFARIEGSDDLGATLLTELLEMVDRNVHVQKCEYCHRYFLPYSAKARYCDRVADRTGKTCKDLAAKEKHEKKIAADEGLNLIRPADQKPMTCAFAARRLSTRTKNFQKWKAHAEEVRDLYIDGKLTFNQLEALSELPPRK